MTAKHAAPFKIKAVGPADGLAAGEFIGYASTFGGPPDSYGDVIDPGAFTDTLAAWEASGDTLPVLWGHDLSDPFANIGSVLSAEEDDHGLKVHARLDVETNPTAAQVAGLVKGRRINTMSFAYKVVDAAKAADGQHLKALDLIEVSLVPIPANDRARVVAAKSAGTPRLNAALAAILERTEY